MIETFIHSGMKIEKITENGNFGSFLFFSSSDAGHGDYVYSLELDTNEIIEAGSLFYNDECEKLTGIVKTVMSVIECDKETAENLLDETTTLNDIDKFDDENELWIQAQTAACAKILGFRGVAVTDEHGTSYMIDMLNKENELKLIS